jgi:anti-sigma factor RsiW
MASEADSIRAQLRISCADSTMLLTEYDEEALAASDRERLEAHLAGCQACGVYLDQLRVTAHAIRRLRPSSVDADTMARLVEIYRHRTP